MLGVRKSTSKELPTQGSMDLGRVRDLSSSNNSSSTSVLKIMRPFYDERILFFDPLASLPLKEEEVFTSFEAIDSPSNPLVKAPQRRKRLIIGEVNRQEEEEKHTMPNHPRRAPQVVAETSVKGGLKRP